MHYCSGCNPLRPRDHPTKRSYPAHPVYNTYRDIATPQPRKFLMETAAVETPSDSMEVDATATAAPVAGAAAEEGKPPASVNDDKAAAKAKAMVAAVVAAALPEVEVYLSTLALTTLLRHKAEADSVGIAPKLLERAVSFNRRCGLVGEGGLVCCDWMNVGG